MNEKVKLFLSYLLVAIISVASYNYICSRRNDTSISQRLTDLEARQSEVIRTQQEHLERLNSFEDSLQQVRKSVSSSREELNGIRESVANSEERLSEQYRILDRDKQLLERYLK